MVHEIQHLIQIAEDFAKGGDPASVLQAIDAEIKSTKEELESLPQGDKRREELSKRVEDLEKVFQGKYSFSEKELNEMYRRLGGEQEANEVSERLDNPKGTPRVHSDDTIIVHGEKEKWLDDIKFSGTVGESELSGNETLEQMFQESTDVDESELSEDEWTWIELGESLGVKIQWIEADPKLSGTFRHGKIYLNRNADTSVSKLFWHEQFHLLSKLNPSLKAELIRYFRGTTAFTKEQLDAYRSETGRRDLSDNQVIEEILCDNFAHAQKRVQLMRAMSKDNPRLTERFVACLKYLADKVVSAFHTPEGSMTKAQRDAFIKGINDLADTLRNAKGEKLFAVQNNELTLANGTPLERPTIKNEAAKEMEALRKKYKGTDKWMKAPNGKRTNLTEEQWLLVRTKAFKDWFGDWENDRQNASQVVDDNGEPRVVYHGSRRAGFSVFDNRGVKGKTAAPEGSNFFSSSPDVAKSYSGTRGIVRDYGETAFEKANGGNYACFLNIRNPAFEDFDGADWEGKAYGKYRILDEDLLPIYNDKNGLFFDTEKEAEEYAQSLELDDYTIEKDPWLGYDTNEVVRNAMHGDYGDDVDGVIIDNVIDEGRFESDGEPATDYIVFNSNQIKSATDNIGSFSAEDDDIRYSGNLNAKTPASTKWTDERITQAAKNPQIFNGLTQHGAKLKDGKIVFANKQAREHAIRFLNAVTNPNFKFAIAYHGSPHQFDEFSLDAVGSGEGSQVHGWGLYFAADRNVSKGYRMGLSHPQLVTTIAGHRYEGTGSLRPWQDENGHKVLRRSNAPLYLILKETVSLRNALIEQQEALSEEEEFEDFGFEEETDDWEIEEDDSLEKDFEKERGKYPTITYDMIHGHLKDQLSAYTGTEEEGDYEQALKLLEDSGSFKAETKFGSLFKVEIPDSDVMLDEQETFDNQPPKVQAAVKKIAQERGITLNDDTTGREIYDAIANTFDSNIHEGSIPTSKLLNKHGVKGIVYEGEDDGLCYVVFDDKAIKILERESRVGPKGKLENSLRDDELTPVQKAIKDFCENVMGITTTFFRSHSDTQGAFQEGAVFINVNSVATPEWVFHHEVGHWLAVNNPQLFNRLVKILGITQKQRDDYRKGTQQPDLTDAQVDAEILCDKMGDIAQRLNLFKEVGKKDASLVERLVAWFKAALDKFTDFFFTKENGLTRSQRDRLYDSFGKIVREILDEKGNKLFRYNSKTHAIERADGTPLPAVALTEANAKEGTKYSFAGEQGAKNLGITSKLAAAKLMERRGFSRDEIYKATGFVKSKKKGDVDDQWRYEIPDDLDKIDFDELNEHAMLGELYDNEKLYEAYPRLWYMPVVVQKRANAKGGYNHHSKVIELNPDFRSDWKGTLVHEIQHAIQDIEGFARGGTSETAKNLLGSQAARTISDDEAWALLGGEQEAEEVRKRAEDRQELSTPEVQEAIARAQKYAEETRRKLDGVLKKQGSRVQSLAKEYMDVKGTDKAHSDALRKALPQDVLKAADNAFYAERAWLELSNGLETQTPTIHTDDAIITFNGKDLALTFAGKKAKTADQTALKRAIRMESVGFSRAAIFKETGWFKGKDGKWRFEIPDHREGMNLEKLILPATNEGKKFNLEEIYDNPELYAAYPWLRKIKISTPNDKDLKAGFYGPATIGKRIIMNSSDIDDDIQEAQGSLVHEIQHLIQDYEKFATGGNPENIKWILRRALKNAKQEIAKISNGKEYFYSLVNAEKARKAGDKEAETRAREHAEKIKPNLTPKGRQKLEKLLPRYLELKEAVNTPIRDFDEQVDLYLRLAGEQEAFEVEERLDNREDIPRSHSTDALIVFDGHEYSIAKAKPSETKKAAENGNRESVDGREPPSAATANGTTLRSHSKSSAKADDKGGVSHPTANVESDSPRQNIPQDRDGVKGQGEKSSDKAHPNRNLPDGVEETLRDDELTTVQKAVKEFCAKMGIPVEFFRGNSRNQGALKNGTVFININAKMTPEWIFHHEVGHWLAVINPQLFNRLVDILNITDEQRDAYRKATNKPNLTDAEVNAEILCDKMGDVAQRLQLFKDVGKADASLAQRLVAWIKAALDKFTDFFFTKEPGLTRSQRDRLYDTFGKITREILDERGNKIFRYNSKTRAIERADGTPLPEVALTEANDRARTYFSTAGKNSKTQSPPSRPPVPPSTQQQARNASKSAQEEISKEAAEEETQAERSWLQRLLHKLAKKLGIDYDRIIVGEDERNATRKLKKKAMEEFLEAEEAYRKNRTAANESVLEKKRERLRSLGVTSSDLNAFRNGEENSDFISPKQYWLSSPGRIAEKIPLFRTFFQLADKALDELIKSRARYARMYQAALNLVPKAEDRKALFALLWLGDRTKTVFGTLSKDELDDLNLKAEQIAAKKTDAAKREAAQLIHKAMVKKICAEQGVSENVAEAYIAIRRILEKMWHDINEARRHPQRVTKWLSDQAIDDLKNNKFVDQSSISIKPNRDATGRRAVTYKEYANVEREYVVGANGLKRLQNSKDVQILAESTLNRGKKPRYLVRVREGYGALKKETGYIPHFFHEYSVVVKDKRGQIVVVENHHGEKTTTIGTARTELDAVRIANEWLKDHKLKDGEHIYVEPRSLSRELGIHESQLGELLGDKNYVKMTTRLAENYSDVFSSSEEAEAKLHQMAEEKNKPYHRSLKNIVNRTDAKGFEEDMDWVLRQYMHIGTRYVALESWFKPQAMSAFERIFGAFDDDYSGNDLAQYTKQFILDVNGNPTWIETFLNKIFNHWKPVRTFIAPMFEGRKLITVTDTATRFVAYAKLGFLNVSCAVLNLTQFINAGAYVGYPTLAKYAVKLLKQRGKLTLGQLRILDESGVLNDLGLDTVSDFDKNQVLDFGGSWLDKLDYLGNKTMILFQSLDSLCRAATTLAAYEEATQQGKTKAQALKHAADINRKANFSYGIEDAPNIFRRSGPLGKVLLQFYKYPIKELEIISDVMPFSKATTLKQKLKFWGPYFLLCGLMGIIPGFDWGDDFLSKHFKIFPKDFVEKAVISACQEIFGADSDASKTAARTLLYGAPAVVNVNTSSRAGLSDILPKDFNSFLMGALGSTIWNTARHTANEDYANALQSFSPGLYNYYAAFTGESASPRDRKNYIYDTAWKRIVRAVGFKTADETAVSDEYRIYFNEKAELQDERQDAIDDFLNAYEDGDQEAMRELEPRLAELGVTQKQLKNEWRRKHSTRGERLEEGIMSKRERADYRRRFGNFAEPE